MCGVPLGRTLPRLCRHGVSDMGGIWALKVPAFSVILGTNQMPPSLYSLRGNLPFCGSQIQRVWQLVSPASRACLAGRGACYPSFQGQDSGCGFRVLTPGLSPAVTLPPNTSLRIWNQAAAPFLPVCSVITDPLPGPLR